MKKLTILTTILFILLLSGCNLFRKNPIKILDYQVNKDITTASASIKENTKNLSKSSKTIKKKATDIKKEVKEIEKKDLDINPNLNKIIDSSNSILDETNNIENIVKNLNLTQTKLDIAKDKIKNIEKDLKILEKERDEAIVKRDEALEGIIQQTQKNLQLVIFFCLVGFGISVAVFFMGSNKIGIAGAGASIASLFLAIVVSQHLVFISWIGMAILGVISLFLVYQSFIQKNTNKELIKTTELTKEKLSDKDKEEIFGLKKIEAKVNEVQSKNTKKIVEKIKKKIKK